MKARRIVVGIIIREIRLMLLEGRTALRLVFPDDAHITESELKQAMKEAAAELGLPTS